MQNYNGEAKRNIAKYHNRNLILRFSFYKKINQHKKLIK